MARDLGLSLGRGPHRHREQSGSGQEDASLTDQHALVRSPAPADI